LNSKYKEIGGVSFILNPEDFHCSSIKLKIKVGLLLLFTKKGSDNLNLAFLREL